MYPITKGGMIGTSKNNDEEMKSWRTENQEKNS